MTTSPAEPATDEMVAEIERGIPQGFGTNDVWAAAILARLRKAEAERDEARAIIAAADKGHPIESAVERVLDEHSAWIARPSPDVTKAIALATGIAWMYAPFFGANARAEAAEAREADLRAKLVAAREALAEIAKQRLHAEITDSDPDDLDWLGGFEECVRRARTAHGATGPDEKGEG